MAPTRSTPSTQTQTLHLITRTQNLFSNISPSRTTILIHACNTQGVWGAGVALEMKRRFPEAFGAYRAFCMDAKVKRERRGSDEDEDELVGKCMLTFVPPSLAPTSTSNSSNENYNTASTTTPKIIIANLFTRSTYGPPTPQELSPSKPHPNAHPHPASTPTPTPSPTSTYTHHILSVTHTSLTALLTGLLDLHTQGILSTQDISSMELRMPKINSGRFMVEWELVRQCVEGVVVPSGLREVGWEGGVVVCSLE